MDQFNFHRASRGVAAFVARFFSRDWGMKRRLGVHMPSTKSAYRFGVACAFIAANAALADQTAFAQSAPAKPGTQDGAKAASALHLEQLQLLALGPNEGRAVFQFPDHSMKVVRAGELIPGLRATLVAVEEDKVVIEETVQSERDKQSAQKQTVWMSKSQSGTAGKVQRFAFNGVPSVSEKPPTAVIVPLSGPKSGQPAGQPKTNQ